MRNWRRRPCDDKNKSFWNDKRWWIDSELTAINVDGISDMIQSIANAGRLSVGKCYKSLIRFGQACNEIAERLLFGLFVFSLLLLLLLPWPMCVLFAHFTQRHGHCAAASIFSVWLLSSTTDWAMHSLAKTKTRHDSVRFSRQTCTRCPTTAGTVACVCVSV